MNKVTVLIMNIYDVYKVFYSCHVFYVFNIFFIQYVKRFRYTTTSVIIITAELGRALADVKVTLQVSYCKKNLAVFNVF